MHVQAVRILTKCGVTILGVFVYIPCPLCRVLARTHPILTTGVTAHGTHGHVVTLEIGLAVAPAECCEV
jgi:hypothetical protein